MKLRLAVGPGVELCGEFLPPLVHGLSQVPPLVFAPLQAGRVWELCRCSYIQALSVEVCGVRGSCVQTPMKVGRRLEFGRCVIQKFVELGRCWELGRFL